MSEPNWVITTIIGAIVGYLTPYAVKMSRYMLRRFEKEIAEGTWHVYHPTIRDGSALIEHSIWNISKGILVKYVVKETKAQSTSVIYKGDLRLERNHWLIKLRGVRHAEEASIRFYNPVPTEDARTWGLYVSIDYHGNPISGPGLISREELSDAEVMMIITKKFTIDTEFKILVAL